MTCIFNFIALRLATMRGKKVAIFALCLLSFSANIAFAQSPSQTDALTQLDSNIQDIIKKYNIPSVAFAVLVDGQPTHMQAYGMANKEAHSKAKLSTQYRIASISKMIVSIAIMQLVEAGELKLDDNISDLLPDLAFKYKWAASHPLQLKHLLESTTGWDGISLQEFAYNNQPPLDLTATLNVNPNSRESRWPPGTRHAYSNAAATVAALIVEKKTGQSFYSYVQQHIFTPLDMESASYSEPHENSAVGYKNGKAVVHKNILFRPSGALLMSLEDMARLSALFINRGRLNDSGDVFLQASTIKRMEYSHTSNVGEFAAGYGLFNYARYYDGVRYRGHDGSLPGWLSELSYSPKHKVGFVVLQNSENGRAFREIVTAISTHLAEGFNTQTPNSADVSTQWENMSGYYRYQNPRLQKRFFVERLVSAYRLQIKGNSAVFTSLFPPGWKRQLSYQGNDTWQNEKGEEVLKLGEDPIAEKVIHYGDRVFVPVSAINAWLDKVILLIWGILLLTMILHSLFWPIQYLRGKFSNPDDALSAIRAVHFRLKLSLACWSVVLFLLFLWLGMASPIDRLGHIGFYSLALWLTSLLMFIATVWAIYSVFIARKFRLPRFLYIYSAVYLFVQAVVVFYLLYFGVIGIRSWT